jgi:hypothetical protein
VVRVAEAQEDLRGIEGVGQRDQRRDADAAADQDRAPVRRAPALPQRPRDPDLVLPVELHQPLGAGADVVEQERQPALAGAQDAERPRQERALAVAATPALDRGDHVELSRLGRRPVRIVDVDDDVRPVGRALHDRARAAAEHHTASVARCSSCRESTSAWPRAAAPIARAAAVPPDRVVRHGMPRAIAARRIS